MTLPKTRGGVQPGSGRRPNLPYDAIASYISLVKRERELLANRQSFEDQDVYQQELTLVKNLLSISKRELANFIRQFTKLEKLEASNE